MKKMWFFVVVVCFMGCVENNVVNNKNKFIDWEVDWMSDCDVTTSKSKDVLLSCSFKSFMENFTENFRCDEIYFIKGVVQNTAYTYGSNIKIIEDLKGNFPKGTESIFTVFGDGTTFIELNRLDDLRMYKEQDTLLMLLAPARDLLSLFGVTNAELVEQGRSAFYEYEVDGYTTMNCAVSVLKLSSNYVEGYILPWMGETDITVNTMEYNEFIDFLKLTLKK